MNKPTNFFKTACRDVVIQAGIIIGLINQAFYTPGSRSRFNLIKKTLKQNEVMHLLPDFLSTEARETLEAAELVYKMTIDWRAYVLLLERLPKKEKMTSRVKKPKSYCPRAFRQERQETIACSL